MLSVKKALTKILTWINGTGRYYSAAWTASSTSAYGTKVTGDISLGKGLYVVVVTSPYVSTGSPLVGLRTDGVIDNTRLVTLWNNAYTKAAFLVEMSSAGKIALHSEGSAAAAYSATERGSLTAIKLGGGYLITLIMSTISRLAERWWEYVEHEKAVNESTLETDGQRSKKEHTIRQLSEKEWNSIRRLLHSWGHDSQYELPGSWNASDRVSSVRHILWERWNEHRKCWRILCIRHRQYRGKSIQRNNFVLLVPNGVCSNGLATISERGWACA